MLELTDIHPNVDIQESEYNRLLGYPPHQAPEGRAAELANEARKWYAANGRPWVYAREADGLKLNDGKLGINGTDFAARSLHDQLATARAHDAVLVAVSAGRECEDYARQLWQEGKPDEYFFIEMYGSAVVEHLITVIGGRICAWAEESGMTVLPHYSPGYSGWDIADQTRLWQLIRGDGRRQLPGDIQVFDTGMLSPKKSLLALFGVTRHLDRVRAFQNLVPCENCSLPGCQYRRAPYRLARPQMEDVRRLQAGPALPHAGGLNGFALKRSAKYSINARALQKWSEERLQLKTRHDGSIEATFRYEGTTCSSLGQPLEYDYHLELSGPEAGYRILQASCVPAPGDAGHAAQCEYLAGPESFMRAVASEKPLLGRPLNDVLTWQRAYHPSGCYCDAERRAHKWGLVFEVIHYALVQRDTELERAAANGVYGDGE